jgi:hypothetical protein
MAIVMAKLNDYFAGKCVVMIWLTGHTIAFIVLSPLSLWLSIPICMMLLAYIIWSMGLYKRPAPVNIDTPDIAGELLPVLQDDISVDILDKVPAEVPAEITEIPGKVQFDNRWLIYFVLLACIAWYMTILFII